MKLQTPVPLPDYPLRISHEHQLLSMGSCFAEHMGGRLQRLQFQQQLNPFGIVYHPVVLAGLLARLLANSPPLAEELFEVQGLWRHYDYHSRYAAPDRAAALAGMQTAFAAARAQLPQLDRLLLTLGSAHAYRAQDTGRLVNNCHKQHTSLFSPERSTVTEVVEALGTQLAALKAQAPQLEVVLTVSPVRHLRNGLLESQRSKAVLLLAGEELCRQLSYVYYFPAYEIQLDELRDYRFYARDMLHPNELAIDYIWERFQSAFLTDDTQALNQRIEQVTRGLAHRPLHPESAAAMAFQAKLARQVKELEEVYGFLRF